jgi:hypothetical protein
MASGSVGLARRRCLSSRPSLCASDCTSSAQTEPRTSNPIALAAAGDTRLTASTNMTLPEPAADS